ncbi:MAG: hypothetical protein J6S59_06900, partial [Clostridia bacterium]|nr:hypothetical protein [Clostridia bacterium]
SIATKYQPDGYNLDAKLLRYRTLQTIMLTAMEIVVYLHPWFSEVWVIISLCMIIIYLIAGICLMKALFRLRRCYRRD